MDRSAVVNALPSFCAIRVRSGENRQHKTKHGINFVEAQALWKSKHVLLGAKGAPEKRYLVSTGPLLSPIAERQFGLLV